MKTRVMRLVLLGFCSLGGVGWLLSGTPEMARGEDAQSEAVQLWAGGPLWATCNVGASQPHERGSYFWWGDTVGYIRNAANDGWISADGKGTPFEFTETTVPTHRKIFDALQEEGWVDARGRLVAAHDAATVHLGASWRMPRNQEFTDLVNNCDSSWTKVNGVWGRKVTGRGTFASKSIFLPAAGYGKDNGWYDRDTTGEAEGYGYYWTSQPLSGNSKSAFLLQFDFQNFDREAMRSYDFRYYGRSIRAVQDPPPLIEITDADVALDPPSATYDEKNHKPAVTVTVGETVLVEDTDYTLTNEGGVTAGTYMVTVVGKGNYTGTVQKTFAIVPKDIGLCAIDQSPKSVVYNGEEQRPYVVVAEFMRHRLVEGTDYTLANSGGVNAGVYPVTIVGIGNYGGVVSNRFEILKADVSISAAPTASAKVEKGAALGTVSLVGGAASLLGTFAWTEPSTTVTEDGDFEVTFTPSDATNYQTVSCRVAVQVRLPLGSVDTPWTIGAGTDDTVAAYTNGTGTLVIGGAGAMTSFNAEGTDIPWRGMEISTVQILPTVTRIGTNAWYGLGADVAYNGLRAGMLETFCDGLGGQLGYVRTRLNGLQVKDGQATLAVTLETAETLTNGWTKVELGTTEVRTDGGQVLLQHATGDAKQGFYRVTTGEK